MTNGEKFKEVFKISQVEEGELYAFVWLPNHDAAEISIDWWNAEYTKQTTKNDPAHNLCDSCINYRCEFQSGIVRTKCAFYMPSVTPQEPRWISITECMPKEREWIGTKRFGTTISDEVYVTFETLDGKHFCDHIRFQNGKLSPSSQISIDAISKGAKPIAWMPLPKPYNAESEVDNGNDD